MRDNRPVSPQRLLKEKSREIKGRARFPDRKQHGFVSENSRHTIFFLFCEAHTLEVLLC